MAEHVDEGDKAGFGTAEEMQHLGDQVEPVVLEPTSRGFLRGEFVDRYGQQCSIQESSLADERAIWLGVDVDQEGKETHGRMHLTQEQAAALLPHLQRFVETGELGPES